jgi:hypothetical protein
LSYRPQRIFRQSPFLRTGHRWRAFLQSLELPWSLFRLTYSVTYHLTDRAHHMASSIMSGCPKHTCYQGGFPAKSFLFIGFCRGQFCRCCRS